MGFAVGVLFSNYERLQPPVLQPGQPEPPKVPLSESVRIFWFACAGVCVGLCLCVCVCPSVSVSVRLYLSLTLSLSLFLSLVSVSGLCLCHSVSLSPCLCLPVSAPVCLLYVSVCVSVPVFLTPAHFTRTPAAHPPCSSRRG